MFGIKGKGEAKTDTFFPSLILIVIPKKILPNCS